MPGSLPCEQGTQPNMLDFIEATEDELRYVMQSQAAQSDLESASERWSNRILIAATIGILFLTFFPFRFVSHAKLPAGVSPFLLGKTLGKHPGAFFDDFLNILLFVPFGFGLSETLSERRKSRATILFVVWIAGAVLSYGIELTQLYIPGRDSGWEDVFTNSTGSAAGFLLFMILGGALLRVFTQIERAAESSVTRGRLAVILLIYFSCWFAVSARLQTETKLANWRPDSRLLIGNDAIGKAATVWKGEVAKLEIWDQPLSREIAVAVTGGVASRVAAPEALAAYDFTNGPPFPDRMKSLPDLSRPPGTQGHGDPSQLLVENGKSLPLTAPASRLVTDLQRTNQFAIHVVCKPAEANGSDGQIISISHAPSVSNLTMRQEDMSLVFWFRSPLSARHAQLTWSVPNAFAPNQARNILYSYDGSTLSLYMDGKVAAAPYRLGPGAALARVFRHIKTNELDGYHDIYYGLVFFPAGVALGIAARAARAYPVAFWLSFTLLLIVPPLLFEILLVAVSGRTFSLGNLVLSAALLTGGALWINADGKRQAPQPVG
jgi:glycopeptide antibiotics resistance protein